MSMEANSPYEYGPFPETAAIEMLALKLEWYRDTLTEPRTDNPHTDTVSLYKSVAVFDPRNLVAGEGYGVAQQSFTDLALEILRDTRNASAEDFLAYMTQPVGLPRNPLLDCSSSPAKSVWVKSRIKNDGFIINANVPKGLVIDPKPDEWEKQLYLFGPIHPSWIESITSMRSVNERMRDKDAPVRDKCTRSSFEYHGFSFNKTPKEVLEAAQGSKLVHDALLRAILIDGAGKKYSETNFKSIKPLSSTENFKELLDCLYVMKMARLSIGKYSMVHTLAQVNGYLRGDNGIDRVENPYVQESLIRIGLAMVKQGKTY